MKRPVRPDSMLAFLALSRREKELWWVIDKAERSLLDIQEKKEGAQKVSP